MKRRKLAAGKMKRRKHNTHESEDKIDVLSDLPECVLLHILSFLDAAEAVRTCLLSTRWKHIWKRLQSLTLDFCSFSDSNGFNEFCNQILSLRDASTTVSTLNFDSGYRVEPALLERIVNYAVSRHVNSLCLSCKIEHIPPSLFSCPSLTSLEIAPSFHMPVEFPNSLNLPALTYLKLSRFSFCSGKDGLFNPFSTFNKLNTLILLSCIVPDAQTLYISSTTLLNLSIDSGYCFRDYLNIELCTPNLHTFTFRPFMKISGSNLFSIEQVTIDLDVSARKHARKDAVNRLILLLYWLIELVNIKSLTVSKRTLQALSLIPDLLKLKSPSWYNLKSLKLKVPRSYGLYIMNQRDVNLELAGKSKKEKAKLRKASKAIDFLLQNSSSAKVDIIS